MNQIRLSQSWLNHTRLNQIRLNHRWLDQGGRSGRDCAGLVSRREIFAGVGAEALVASGIAEKIFDALMGERASACGGGIDGHSADRVLHFHIRQG
jgi:hypothetical protein